MSIRLDLLYPVVINNPKSIIKIDTTQGKEMTQSTAPVVIYHDHCIDGTCAAWVASQYLPKDAVFVPVSYGKQLIEEQMPVEAISNASERTIYILDWCPEMVDLDDICSSYQKVVLIDHHESAIKKLQDHYDFDDYEFVTRPKNLEMFLATENQWSGAMGTAMWFSSNYHKEHGGIAFDLNLKEHWLVKAVDDRDRWQFKLPNTKEINEGLFHMGTDLNMWKPCPFDENQKLGLIINGTLLIQKKQKDCESIVKSCTWVDEDTNVAVCNCSYLYASDAGNMLAKKHRMAIMWYIDKDFTLKVSLRSNKETAGWINCAEFAAKHKGGGHANAAGFELQTSGMTLIEIFDEMIDRIEI